MPEYGLEIRRGNGSLALTTRETLLRLVHVETLSAGFNGTFSVPDFDATVIGHEFTGKGFFYVQQRVTNPSQGGDGVAMAAEIIPSLTWNNSDKVMTVTQPSIPSGWRYSNLQYEYDVVFLHFR